MAAERLPGFRGRSSECALLDRLLADVRGGESAVLVIRGEAGMGKTALLHYTAARASDFRVVQIAGVESEMELAYAGLHQLCAPMLDRQDVLLEPQRAALNIALGLAAGDPPDRFLVALAALGLLSAIAGERPLLCVVDDLQWLDDASARVLGFVARRLLAEPVGLVFAVREPSGEHQLVGLPELPLRGLDDVDARALLETVIPGRLDERVRDRIVAETRGNPLALMELPRGMSAAELAGGFALAGLGALSGSIEDGFRRRLDDRRRPARHRRTGAVPSPAGALCGVSLLHRPVEALRPVGDELAEVREVGPERPPSVLGRVRPACRAQPRSSDNSIMSTVTRRALTAWLIDHGFTELGGKATSHRRFRHESGVVITVPGHGRQNLSQKHVGMIVRQLEALGFDRDTVRRDLNAR